MDLDEFSHSPELQAYIEQDVRRLASIYVMDWIARCEAAELGKLQDNPNTGEKTLIAGPTLANSFALGFTGDRKPMLGVDEAVGDWFIDADWRDVGYSLSKPFVILRLAEQNGVRLNLALPCPSPIHAGYIQSGASSITLTELEIAWDTAGKQRLIPKKARELPFRALGKPAQQHANKRQATA